MSQKFQAQSEEIQNKIRDLAYLMWDAAGRQQGMAMEYWLAAEKEVLSTMQKAARAVMPSTEKKASKPEPAKPAATPKPAAAPKPAAPAATPAPAAAKPAASEAAAAKPAAKAPAAKKPASRARKTTAKTTTKK